MGPLNPANFLRFSLDAFCSSDIETNGSRGRFRWNHDRPQELAIVDIPGVRFSARLRLILEVA